MSDEIVSFTPNPNLEKELHTFPKVTANTQEVANRIAEVARGIAPVVTGRYRDGIRVDKPQSKNGVARVVASDQKSSWVEFGNDHQPAQYVMRNAVEIAGYEFKKGK